MLIKKTQQLLSANEPIIGYTKDQKFNALIEIKCNLCLRQMSYELILIILEIYCTTTMNYPKTKKIS